MRPKLKLDGWHDLINIVEYAQINHILETLGLENYHGSISGIFCSKILRVTYVLFLWAGLIFFLSFCTEKKNPIFVFIAKFRMLRTGLQSHRILDQGRALGNPLVQPVLTDKIWDLLAILKVWCVCIITLLCLTIQQETIIK